MPASRILRLGMKSFALILIITITFPPSHINTIGATTASGNVPVSLLFNYGNGILEWHNNTFVLPAWNFFNVTLADANGNVGALFFASFGSHFVYLINGVGCPTVFNCELAWSFWVLEGPCWTLPEVGVDQVPVSAGATAAWFLVPVATFGENQPTGPGCINATVDVKPGSDATPINIKSSGLIPVAVLTTASLDASKINPSSVRFGPTGTEAAPAVPPSLEDVDGDGSLDLVLQFKTQDAGFKTSDTQAVLTGTTMNGVGFIGTDTVHVFLPGDVNGDLKVNILDAAAIALAYQSKPGMSNWNPRADFDGDNRIDILDVAIVAFYYGQ